jgi:hypothetical protein
VIANQGCGVFDLLFDQSGEQTIYVASRKHAELPLALVELIEASIDVVRGQNCANLK